MFLQVHFLTPYTGVLLNRDDVGFAKRLPVGNATRTRVSSQCLKRHWRQHEGRDGILSIADQDRALRSRETFDARIRQRLVEGGVAEDVALALTTELMDFVGMKADGKKKTSAMTGQVTVLGPRELDYLFEEAKVLAAELGSDAKNVAKEAKTVLKARAKDKDWKKNLKALGAGLDVAMFGRMVTGDVFAGMDAAIHVAHAFTVHAELSESDYFSAVDDLLQERGETGSGHINTQEINSGLFYGYVVVDVPLLVANLTGTTPAEWRAQDRVLAAEVVSRLVKTIATVSPGAKVGSTAPYSRASFLGIECGDTQPCSLANAFLKAVPTDDDVVADTFRALSSYVADFDDSYGFDGERRHLALGPVDAVTAFGEKKSLSEIADFAANAVRA